MKDLRKKYKEETGTLPYTTWGAKPEYVEWLEQHLKTVAILRKSLVDEIERFDEVLEDEDSTLYRGMRDGLQKSLDLLDMRILI